MKHMLPLFILILIVTMTPLYGDNGRAQYRTVEKLLVTMRMEKNYQFASKEMIDLYLKQAPHMRPYKKTIEKFFYRHMHYDQVKAGIVKGYQRRFSESEIQDLITFYSTPVGRKMAKGIAEMMVHVIRAGVMHFRENKGELEEMIARDVEVMMRSLGRKPLSPESHPEIDPFQ